MIWTPPRSSTRSASSPLLAVLMLIAAVPFALVCCDRASSDAPTPIASASTAQESRPTPSEVTSASVAFVDAAASAPTASSSTTATIQTPKAKCEQTRRNVNALVAQSLACTTDADCTQMYMSCGFSGVCGISVAKGSESKIRAAEKPWDAASCTLVTGAPCPTCAMPPPPKCVGGKCS